MRVYVMTIIRPVSAPVNHSIRIHFLTLSLTYSLLVLISSILIQNISKWQLSAIATAKLTSL